MLEKIFAFEPEEIVVETKLPDGTTRITFEANPKHPDYVASSLAHETQKEE